MILCNYCKAIPIENPPPLPLSYIDGLPGLPDGSGGDLYYVEYRDALTPYPTSFGYPHWPSQGSLERSSLDCDLCNVLLLEFRRIVYNTSLLVEDNGFYITQRENNQQGFVVWTYGEQGNILRVGAYSYWVEADDPLSNIFKGRKVYNIPNTYTKEIAKNWISDCVNNQGHSLCGPPNGPPAQLPTRVINLGSSPSSNQIQLFKTDGNIYDDYCILSYTWGNGPHPYQLTKANEGPYMKKIDPSILPRTIMDAIGITKMLGVQYLWVDALCIIQHGNGSDQDKQNEIPKMMDYYGSSYVTITAAASKSVYDGIFLSRDPHHIQSCELGPNYTSYGTNETGKLTIVSLNPHKENIHAKYLQFEDEPITTRGWTLQERVLSTRNIIYASDQMYYECNTHFLSEDGLYIEGRQQSTNLQTKELSLFGAQKQDVDEMWDLLVENYSGRHLKGPDENKFNAIGGLARKFASLNHDTYIAGLWKKKFLKSLFWSVTDYFVTLPAWPSTWPPTTNYRAPSWSWACVDRTVSNPDGRIYSAHIYAQLVKPGPHVTLVNTNDPYGQITSASIRLYVPGLLPVHFKWTNDANGRRVYTWYLLSSWDPNQTQISVSGTTSFDYNITSGALLNVNIYALVLARDTSGPKLNMNDVYYLCLLLTGADKFTFRRLGIVWLEEEALGRHAPHVRPQTSWKDVTLV